MTPGARVAAAIDVLDAIVEGATAEQALSRWARGSRYAGSKDRAAVRDYVFDVLRHWRSDALRGGGEKGRARMIGRLRAQGADLEVLFDGAGYGAAPLSEDELSVGAAPQDLGSRWDMPDWLIPLLQHSLGDDAERTALALTDRAPVTLRVNAARTTAEAAIDALAKAGVIASTNARAATALTVTEGARRIRNSVPYQTGLVELQDAASQAAVAGLCGTGRALDFCAGGGGKALALAAAGWDVTAHDIAPDRMQDLPARAARGGHEITMFAPDDLASAGQFDLVFCDAPCSGSGTWRRTPEAKWSLTAERLADLCDTQASVLEAALPFVVSGGSLVYATCSILEEENAAQIAHFLNAHRDWRQSAAHTWPVDAAGDGFFCAHLTQRA
ncbi:RsmB/NOP family class I SAM-dependent RNA methyltransferase [Tateyamaria pelophila]|uniref:RsmB/NOP family class I SAM-dependent RNA methyltransferase n=1 Tax=Tateyamaria pelophila TaxID=328415 RepID=UPI001CBBC673|nr:RsmB/NOP family class I SAM-dependent RNA methyltransferase [Tateyamaria pelophila]